MLECIILIASAKIPVGKRWNFSWPYIKDFLQHPTNHHPPTIKAPPKNKN